MLKDGESESDYATLLDGHSFEIGMAPDRFATVGSSASAQITDSTVVDADAYAAGFPAGGVTLTYDGAAYQPSRSRVTPPYRAPLMASATH